MKKEFLYNLNNDAGQGYPALPTLHDYEIFEVSFKNGLFSITCNDIGRFDDNYKKLLGFEPKKVTVCAEVENKHCLEFEVTKVKYGKNPTKNTSLLNLEEFLKVYKKYKFCILQKLVAYKHLRVELWGEKRCIGRGHYEGAIIIDCESVKYIWED